MGLANLAAFLICWTSDHVDKQQAMRLLPKESAIIRRIVQDIRTLSVDLEVTFN